MEKRIEFLVELGKKLDNTDNLQVILATAQGKNPWFVPEFTTAAFKAVATDMLSREKLVQWLKKYWLKEVDRTVGLIFAGNIPLVGFHDFMCCYLTGCRMKIKLSSKDDALFPFVLNLLIEIDPSLKDKVELVDTIKNYDAIIATGSDNTNRYFEYYFRNHPKILRKNRNSVAILTGGESTEELEALADDALLYFGMGCRNVSKL